MRGLFTNQTLVLQPGQAVSGIAAREQTLRIHSGRVWITVEGVNHDYFLHAGDTFTAIPGRLTVIEADQEAHVDCRRASNLQALHGVRSLLAQAAARLTRPVAVQATLQRHRLCNDACC